MKAVADIKIEIGHGFRAVGVHHLPTPSSPICAMPPLWVAGYLKHPRGTEAMPRISDEPCGTYLGLLRLLRQNHERWHAPRIGG